MFRKLYPVLLIFTLPVLLTAQEEIEIPVPFYVDGLYSGEITLRINDKILIQPRPLMEELRPLLDEIQLETTISRWEEEEWVPYESLGGSLIKADFDEKLLIFYVEVPPESRKPGAFSLIQDILPPSGNLVEPANFSGVLNLEAWAGADYEDRDYDFEFNPELALNYTDYVMELKGGVQSEGDLLFLDYLRFVKDIPQLTARAEGGDLSYDANGFLSTAMVGLSFYRKTALDRSYHSQPELGQTIFFPEPAEVEITINERSVKKTSVPAGTWTFKNFPLSQGMNEVVISWTDSSGDHEKSFFQIYDSGLLKADEVDWGISVGTDSWTTFNPALLLHISNGLSDTITAGASTYYEGIDGYFALEGPILYATTWGTFSFVPSVDLTMGESFGLGMTLNHSYSEKRPNKLSHSFGSSWGFRTEMDSGFYQSYTFRGYYLYSPFSRLSFNPSLSWSYDTDDKEQGLEISMRVRTSGGDGSAIAVDMGVTLDSGEWVPQASITYSASLPEIQQNFYAKADLNEEKMTLSWNRYSGSNEQTDYTLGASSIIPANNEDRFTLSLNGGYLHPLFTLNLSQGFNAFFDTNDINNSTILSGGTALVYADGVLGFSQPVRDSFVIIESNVGPLAVNPTSHGSLLEMSGERPAILSPLSSYRYTTLRMMPETLPVGSDINDYTLSVYPTYRSGTLIRANEKVYMYAGGILTDRKDRPLALVLGDIRPRSPETLPDYEASDWPREFFTDEEGYFECYGL
ncbi:MAG: hypothetical protein PQJ60_03095, partial [Spirochaetales bacterium]|nr:hypothetical protein [Spirochaetales bacterium]